MAATTDLGESPLPSTEKTTARKDEIEDTSDVQNVEVSGMDGDVVYLDEEEEPELHMRTYVALGAMFLLNYAMVIALQGPPAVVCSIHIQAISKADPISCSLPLSVGISMLLRVKHGYRTHFLFSKLCWAQ